MKKRFLALFLAIVMVVSLFPVTVSALEPIDVPCINLYRDVYTDYTTGDPYYLLQLGDADWNSYYFAFKNADGPMVGQTYTIDDMIAGQTYTSVNWETDQITTVSLQRSYEGLQEKFTASVTTQSGQRYNLTWEAADVPASVEEEDLNTTIQCDLTDKGYYKTLTPLVPDDNFDFTIAFTGDLPTAGQEKTYLWKNNTVYIDNANFSLSNDWNTRPFDAKYVIKGVEGGCEGTAEYSTTNGKKYEFKFTYTAYDITNGTTVDDKETNHGYISIDKTTAAEGETVTITINPAEGYQPKSLNFTPTITPSPGLKPITPAKQQDGTYTFKMPGYALTVTAEFETVPAPTYAITNGTAEDDKETNNGYISIDKETAAAGETVTVTVTADEGYQLKSLTVTPAFTFTYMDWDDTNKELVEKTIPADAIEVTNATTELEGGKFYVVKGVDVQTGTLTVNGTATLILMDGAKLTATGSNSAGIKVLSGKALVITGQSGGTGMLIATGGSNGAGIGGGGFLEDGGNVTINGGTVTATGSNGAGIGSGVNSNVGTVTINGGTVTATGANGGAGIGGGSSGVGTVTINGGTVTANGGSQGAGIGSGSGHTSGSTVTINGGTVTATGNAGIGGDGTVTINGGTVTATGVNGGAGIGGGSGNYGTVTINGGTVTATGANGGTGIGGGAGGNGGTVTINGGTVTATGSSDDYGVASAAIGKGVYGFNSGTVTFGEGVNFTINAGADKDNTSSKTTTEYAEDHSAAYVSIESAPANKLLKSSAPKQLKSSAPAAPETITTEEQQDGTYKFTMPAYPVTVTAEFERVFCINYEASDGNVSYEALPESTLPVKATPDTLIKFNVTTTDGYEIASVSCSDSEENPVKVKKEGGYYSFVMPEDDVTIAATAVKTQSEPERPFFPKRKQSDSDSRIVIGGKTAETGETNPDTGAPVMNFGAIAVVLGAAYVLSKKH